MRELRRNARTILFALFGLLLAAPILLSQEKKEEQTAIFKFTETFRSEAASDTDRDSATPNRKESGTFRLEISMPLADFVPADIEIASEIYGVTFGSYKLEVVPNQTMDSKPRRGIRFDYTEGDGKKTPKRITGKVRIRWTLNKIIMSIEGSLTEMGSLVGSLYVEEGAGKFTETTIATVRYGKRAQEFRVAIQGEVRHEKRETSDGGTTRIVEIIGEGKPLGERDDN